jgi:alpha-L-fucosidase
VIFGDAGLDVRWVGNEKGYAYPTTWSNLMRDSVYAGMPEYAEKYSSGQMNGTHWVPAEVDVSIRPGWYYHPEQDDKVKSLKKLMDIYYESVGRNGSLLLNFPVDKRGLIHENDIRQLQAMAKQIKVDFAHNLAQESKASTSSYRGKGYEAKRVLDGDKKTYWATADSVIQASLTIEFNQSTTFNRFLVQEYIQLGQRVKSFIVEARNDGAWREVSRETTIGNKRILRFADVTATAVRLKILDSKACPTISNVEIFYAP